MTREIYTALGFMSGTSLDGVDAAILRTDGVEIYEFGQCTSLDYADFERADLSFAIQKALDWGFDPNTPPPNQLGRVSDIIHRSHMAALRVLQNEYRDHGRRRVHPVIDIIGLHGQTVLHHPPQDGQKGQTLQIANGQSLANETRIDVIYDFRSADVAAGGQGAPLAPIYHEALCRRSKLKGRVAVVNIGGVANISAVEDGSLLWATDCGPGNGPLDSWVFKQTGQSYDTDGRHSFAGLPDFEKIEDWLSRDFFIRPVPRSADRYDFDVLAEMTDMSLKDGAATLAAFCVLSIARDLKAFQPETIIICGGGRHNHAIMQMLSLHCGDAIVQTAEDVDWDGDMLEAQAFAFLAARVMNGLPISFPQTTGVSKPLCGGKIANPRARSSIVKQI